MKMLGLALLLNASSVAAVAAAAFVASRGVDGWGWFLLVSVILGGRSYSSKDETAD